MRWLIAAVFALLSLSARAQNSFPTPGGATAPGMVSMCNNGAGLYVPCPPGGGSGTPATVINVGTFGAVCNGTTDDTAALQAAINAWKTAIPANVNGMAVLTGMGLGGRCLVTHPLDFTGTTSSPFQQVVQDLYLYAVFTSAFLPPNLPLGTVAITAAGTGGTPGTYTNVALTGGTGGGCTAGSIIVGAGGGVTLVSLQNAASNPCTGYLTTDTLTAASASIGGTTGFTASPATYSGGAVMDLTGNRIMHFYDVVVEGGNNQGSNVCLGAPNVGIAVGRITAGVNADRFAWENPVTIGCFLLAGFYNNASELGSYNHANFMNRLVTGSNCYAVVMDGANHFNWSSAFKSVTLPVDTANSFNSNTWFLPDIRTPLGAGCQPLWMENTVGHSYTGGYIQGVGGPNVILYSSDATEINTNLEMRNDHFESFPTVTDCFFITGPNPTPVLNFLVYTDQNSQCSNSVFKTDTNITNATLISAVVQIRKFAGTVLQANSVKLFNTPSAWSVTAEQINLPNAGNWTPPATLGPGGTLCLATICAPVRIPYVLKQSGVAVSNTGIGTTEVNLVSIPIPALNANDVLRISTLWTTQGTATNTKAVLIRLSAAACTPLTTCTSGAVQTNITLNTAALVSGSVSTVVRNANATNAQVANSATPATSIGFSANQNASSAIQTNVGTFLNFDCTTTTAATDTCTLLGYTVEIVPGN